MRSNLKNNHVTIYMSRNKITDDFYIGITGRDINKRIKEHLSLFKRGKRNKFYNAIRKYGPENFIWIKIGEMPTYQEGLDMEVHLISILNPKYNITKGGEGTPGMIHSSKARKKMSAATTDRPKPWLLGVKLSEQHKKSLSERSFWKGTSGPMANKKHSKKTKEKLSLAGKGRIPPNKGKIMGEEYRKKCSLRQIGVPAKNRKGVICIKDNKKFDSIGSAAKFYGISITAVSEICRGKRKNPESLIFKFIGDQ